jgi:hypothetical protein
MSLAGQPIVTGPEAREINGPFKPPIWNGTEPGARVGQHAFDATGALDGTPGPIWWNGSAWVRYGTGTDTGENIGNADLSLTGNRVLSGSASKYKLEFNDLGQIIIRTVLTGVGTMQLLNAGATVIQSDSTMEITSTGNQVIISAPLGVVELISTGIIASSLLSGDVNNKKIVMADDGGNLTVATIGEAINNRYTAAVASDDLLTNSFLNGLFPNAVIGMQKIFTNITDAPDNVAFAIMHAAASWSVKLDFIKCT